MVTAWATALEQVVREWFPFAKSINEDIPERPRTYLKQALESLHAPSGAVMLASSCVDAMLRAKGTATEAYILGSKRPRTIT